MILNCFEESIIKNQDLPPSWREQDSLRELEAFLQENWNLRSIYYLDDKCESTQQFMAFLSHNDIRTNQYIGTIMFNGEQLNIFPKMFCASKEDKEKADLDPKHLMKNLINWLDYCKKASYPYLKISSDFENETSLKELFITLYVGYVKVALERGPYYHYVDKTDDLEYIKGKIDFYDYVQRKLPNGQVNQFRCTFSNFEYDNDINRIIKYTCRLIYPIASQKNQLILNSILARLSEVTVEKCTPSDCDRIRLDRHYENYKIIISMSKMFLQNESVSLNFDFNETFCFLFPTDLLFEGFIGGFILETIEENKGKAYLQKSDMYLIDEFEFGGEKYNEAFNMKLDILVEIQKTSFVLDTKYKEISRFEKYYSGIRKLLTNEIDQGDLYQICEYARKRGIKEVFLLYPMYRYEEKEPQYPTGFSQGAFNEIIIHFIRLPFIFEEDEQKTILMLKSIIKEMFSL